MRSYCVVRRRLSPDSLPARPSPEEIRKALTDMWAQISTVPQSISDDYTTTGNTGVEVLVCTNPMPITITLHEGPSSLSEVKIKRQNAQVTIDPQSNTIDGESLLVLGTRYDGPHLIYTDEGGEWSILS